MYQQFQQPFTSLAGAHLGPYGLGAGLGQVPFAFPYGQQFPFQTQAPIGGIGQALGQQPVPFGYSYGQQPFNQPTVNPLEVTSIVARVLPLLLQSAAQQAWHPSPFGIQPQLAGMIGQGPYSALQTGAMPLIGGSSWGTPFAHY
jgi:hypothetical protein